MPHQTNMDQLAINTMRMLAVDAVQKAKSGHPGTPMDAAPAAYTLWQRVLRYDPADSGWINRDRFVLSSGHASMLLYSLIHLAGIKATSPSYEQIGRDAVTRDDINTCSPAAAALDTPNMAGPRAWRAPPVRSARARQPADRAQFAPAAGLAKGAYVLADATGDKPDVILIASGSEVSLCLAAREQLVAEDVATRVVSMPSWELFEEQDAAYCDSVMPPRWPRG
jgi:transketolase